MLLHTFKVMPRHTSCDLLHRVIDEYHRYSLPISSKDLTVTHIHIHCFFKPIPCNHQKPTLQISSTKTSDDIPHLTIVAQLSKPDEHKMLNGDSTVHVVSIACAVVDGLFVSFLACNSTNLRSIDPLHYLILPT